MTSSCVRLGMILAALVVPSAAAAQIIDTLTDQLPSNPCNGQPTVIDGPSLPGNCSQADQTGLPGVFPGAIRVVYVYSTIMVDARVRPEIARLEIGSAGGASHIVVCQYELSQRTDLSGADRIEVGIEGDMTPAMPLNCVVVVTSEDVIGRTHEARLTMTAIGPGTCLFPMASFSGDFAFSLRLVSQIAVAAGECPLANCGGPFPARSYSLGPFRLVAAATPTRASTWGRVKSLYR